MSTMTTAPTDDELRRHVVHLLETANSEGLTTAHIHSSIRGQGNLPRCRVEAVLVSLYLRSEINSKKATSQEARVWVHAGRDHSTLPTGKQAPMVNYASLAATTGGQE